MANERVLDPVEDGGTVDHGRRRFLTATTAVVGAVGAGFATVPFIKSWNPSARAKLAGAPVTMDISALGEGQRMVDEWRGQPIWVVKRTPKMLEIRSEEHTSELQSLMRISYAVFCLNKK